MTLRYVVLGGGIAGVCCALELTRCLQVHGTAADPDVPDTACQSVRHDAVGSAAQVVLVSGSAVVKGVREVARLSRLVEELEVVETPLEELAASPAAGGLLHVVQAHVQGLDLGRRELLLAGGGSLPYHKLCIATGARPKALAVPGGDHPCALTLRDTDSVQARSYAPHRHCSPHPPQELVSRLRGGRRLLLVGNGGIALELAGALLAGQAAPERRAHVWPSAAPAAPGAATSASASVEAPEVGAAAPAGPREQAERTDGAAAGSASGGAGCEASGGGADGRPELVWAMKHGHIGDAFFDADAAAFLLGSLQGGAQGQSVEEAGRAAGGAAEQGPAGVPGAAPPDESGVEAAMEFRQGRGGVEEAVAVATALAAGGSGARSTPSGAPSAATAGATGESADAAAARAQAGASSSGRGVSGHAAGPAWTRELLRGLAGPGGRGLRGAEAAAGAGGLFRLALEAAATVVRIEDGGCKGADGGVGAGDDVGNDEEERWPAYVTLSNGKVYGIDLVVTGIGVEPAVDWLPGELARAGDGGLAVGRDMRTSDPRVFAAGDCCSCDWPNMAPHWFQMRLWTQARVMGTYAAQCMLGLADELSAGFNFELFTHVTRFLGHKVVFLGLYNGQRLEQEPAEDMVLYSRVGEAEDGSGPTFVRVVLLRGRMQGAVLIGETDLEEAFENLILDGLDLSPYGPHILDPEFELEHIFD
ncbi:hypothetical protein HYH03_002217 [Edaphochlamys debaryana]|uniref:FAD/NAD(P)-binding domain-containing protein n=1 Tax=Edaphochlamys debaryana TaxID=47281 RepID=A0A836C4J8_9CHLO|nr:hypothetical protein HYH03_002217 [Edaphochlamys debaryana]|eukprot:KAG2499930.1 hypothetical protein HYH03_002217 [Edaphochlamys debaryana]